MKKLSSTQAMAVMLFTASTYANAGIGTKIKSALNNVCLLYTSDAADE